MKKFLAMVMTVAMVISMMTVVSFAGDDAVTINFATVKAKAGETVTVPMSVVSKTIPFKSAGAKIKATVLPAGITLATKGAAVRPDGFDTDFFDPVAKAHSYVTATKLHTFSIKTYEETLLDEQVVDLITFTIADSVAPGTYTVNFTPTAKNAAGTELTTAIDVPCKIVVEAAGPSYTNGYYDLKTNNADNTASVSYFGTVDAATLYVATYKAVGTGYELAGVATKDIAAGTVAELTTVTTDAVEGGEVIKAFLWDANLNTVNWSVLPQ